jgi:hypothetical protein
MEEQAAEVEAGGWKVKLAGIDTKFLLLAVIIMICFYGLFTIEGDNKAAFMEQHKITQSLLSQVISNQTQIITDLQSSETANLNAISEMTYVTSLTQEQRAALNIEMPDSLRKKLKGQ